MKIIKKSSPFNNKHIFLKIQNDKWAEKRLKLKKLPKYLLESNVKSEQALFIITKCFPLQFKHCFFIDLEYSMN